MLISNNLLALATLASLAAALPKGGGGGGRSGGSSGGSRSGGSRSSGGSSSSGSSALRGAALGGVGGYALGHHSNAAGDSDPGGESSYPSNMNTQSLEAYDGSTDLPQGTSGLYEISNVTIHQYPGATNGLDGANITMEDFSLMVAPQSGFGLIPPVRCNLTWTASTATPVAPTDATGQLRCPDPSWNVTLDRRTSSPLPGFYVYVQNGTTPPAAWTPKDLSADPNWTINGDTFSYAGPISTSHLPNQTLTDFLGPAAAIGDDIKVTNLSPANQTAATPPPASGSASPAAPAPAPAAAATAPAGQDNGNNAITNPAGGGGGGGKKKQRRSFAG